MAGGGADRRTERGSWCHVKVRGSQRCLCHHGSGDARKLMLLMSGEALGRWGLILSLLAMSQRTLLENDGLEGEKKTEGRGPLSQRWGRRGEWPTVEACVCNRVLRIPSPGCRRQRVGLTSTR